MVWGSNTGMGKRFSLLQNHQDQCWGPPSLLFIQYWGPFWRLKQAGCEVDFLLHLMPRLIEWSCTSAPTLCLHRVGS